MPTMILSVFSISRFIIGGNLRVVVLGGAGYIGSHFSYLATINGLEVIVFDDFSTGHDWAVKKNRLIVGNILETRKLAEVLIGADAVCHFAAKSLVAESVACPDLYFHNNVAGTESVLEAMSLANVNNLVFSSTAACYGMPSEQNELITEKYPALPINPYGQSKLEAEALIETWASKAENRAIAFRYFNAAGAMPEAGLGEAHEPETHLVPNVLKALLSDSIQEFKLYGTDYPTADGTCVRDYVHVKDIALAHLAGLSFLENTEDRFTVVNLGSAIGYSNLEVIKACERVTGRTLNIQAVSRRDGDPPVLVASQAKALDLLGWKPQHSVLEEIILSAYKWHSANG